MRGRITDPILRDASIVVTGAFNPAIFHPSWFIRQGLVSERDIDESQSEINFRELSRFPLGQGQVEVTTSRFQVRTQDEGAFASIKDLAISSFSLLSHTPVENLGINSMFDFQMPDEQTWHEIGDKLANKSLWDGSLEKPVLLQSITLKAEREDDLNGFIQITITGTPGFGIRIVINNHIEIPEGQTASLINILEHHWDRLQSHSLSIAVSTIERCIE